MQQVEEAFDSPSEERSDIFSVGFVEGSDPRGEVAWVSNLWDSILSAPCFYEGTLYAISEEVRETIEPSLRMKGASYHARLCALDASSGQVLWDKPLLDGVRLDSAQVLATDGMLFTAITVRGWGVMLSKNDASNNGQEIWGDGAYAGPGECKGASMEGDVIGLSTVDQDVYYSVYAISAHDANKLWRAGIRGKASAPCASAGAIAYIESQPALGTAMQPESNAMLMVRDARQGFIILRQELGFLEPHGAPAMYAGEALVAGRWALGRYLVEFYDIAAGAADPVWQWDAWLAGQDPPPPGFVAFDGRCIFVGSYGKPVVLDMNDGKEALADIQFDGKIISSPVSNGHLVFFVTQSGRIVAFDPSDGTTVWSIEFPKRFKTKPRGEILYADGKLYCVGNGGILVAIE